VVRLLLASAIAAVAVTMAAQPGAEAAVVAPKLAVLRTAPTSFVVDSGWKCSKRHCFWDPAYNGPVPDYAASWGPPEAATCYYVQRRISKRWAKVCPEVPLQAR
jgi:hypothetical protein